jgi:hypothetical protein
MGIRRVSTHHSGLENERRNNVRISRESGEIAGFDPKKLPENYGCDSWNSGAGREFCRL